MKLFLASSFDKTAGLFVEKLTEAPKDHKVLFCANAADIYENTWWVDLDRNAFEKYGFQLENINLQEVNKEELQRKLQTADILHVCGGSVLYLLGLLQQKQMINVIYSAIQSGGVIYTGTSAGSMIVAPSVALSRYDAEEKAPLSSTSDLTGINLVPFSIIPHCDNKEYLPDTKTTMDHLPENKIPIILLNDNHALWVENNTVEFLRHTTPQHS